MRRFFSRILDRKTLSGRRPVRKAARLQVEGLESRWCPSTTVGTADGGSTLVITGDNDVNKVEIKQNDAANQLTVIADGFTSTFTSSAIKKIKVDLKGDDDYFWWGLNGNTDFVHSKEASIKLGKGDDEAWLEFRGTTSSDVYNNLIAVVDGGKGDDELIAHFARKAGGQLTVQALMGNGDDYAFVNMWGNVASGAKVKFDLQGQKGSDQLSTWNTYDQKVGSYQSIDITSSSTFELYLDGGYGKDSIGITYAGYVDGKLTVRAKGDKGHDSLSAEVYLKSTSNGQLDAILQGNQGKDDLTFNLTNLAGANVSIINALIDGGPGMDTATSTANVTKVNVP